MPAAIVAAAAVVGAEMIAAGTIAISFSGTLMAKIAFAVAMSFVSESLQEKPQLNQSPLSRETENRKQLVRASAGPRRAIYGAARVSGNLVYVANGTDTNYVHLVIALADHRCQAIGDCYLGDEKVGALDAAGNCIEGRFAGHVRIHKYLGTLDQVMDADLAAECPEWGAKDRPGKGVCYVYLRVKRSRDVFPQGLPTPRFDVLGKADILDPRTGLTGYTTNAALCALDYILWEHGFASALDEVNQPSWIAAANICDEDVAVPGGSQKRYAVNGSFTLDRGRAEILDNLRQSMAGMANYIMGQWYGGAGAAEAAVMDIDERDLRGPYRVRPRVADDRVYNAVKGTYTETTLWTETDFPPITNTVYEAQDGGQRLYKDVALAFEIDPYRAQRLAKIDLERHRQGIVVDWPMRIRGLQLRPWNIVRMTVPKLGWDHKLFRVVGWELNLRGGPMLTLEEYAPSIYAMAVEELVTVDPAPDTSLANPLTVATPAAPTLGSGTAELLALADGTVISRIRAAWPAPADAYVRRAELRYRVVGAAEWQAGPSVADPALGFAHLGPVVDGEIYEVQLRFENSLGVRSAWSLSATHTVVGKSAPPSDVPALSVQQNGVVVAFRWTAVADLDLAGYDIRYTPRGHLVWDDGIAVTATTRGTQVTTAVVPPGDWTFHVKARDTSGNASVNAARADLVVGMAGQTVIAQTDQFPLWPGTATHFVRHWTGVLVPASTKTAAECGWELFDEFVPAPQPLCSYEAPETDLAVDGDVRLWAEHAFTLGPGQAGQPRLSLEIDHRLAAGAYDGFEGWSIGTANCRCFKARLVLDTTAGGLCAVSHFKPTADASPRRETFNGVAVAAGGTAIAYARPFHLVPNVQVTDAGGAARIGGHQGATTAGVTARLFDTVGAGIAGTADIVVEGI